MKHRSLSSYHPPLKNLLGILMMGQDWMKRLLTGSHRIFFLPVTTIISIKSDTYNTWQIIHSYCSYKDRKTGNKTILEYRKKWCKVAFNPVLGVKTKLNIWAEMKVFNASPKEYKQLCAPFFGILGQYNMHSIITNAILWQKFTMSFTKIKNKTFLKVCECKIKSYD